MSATFFTPFYFVFFQFSFVYFLKQKIKNVPFEFQKQIFVLRFFFHTKIVSLKCFSLKESSVKIIMTGWHRSSFGKIFKVGRQIKV